jgi:hypothetical protein
MVGDVAEGDPYAWTGFDHGPFTLGAAVALVKGCSPERALEVLGAGRATPVASARTVREWADQQDYQNYGTAVEAGEISGWTLVVELNGYQATVPELLEQLSQDGEAVVIFQNVNALSSFQYAKNGTIVRAFDPLLLICPRPDNPCLMNRESRSPARTANSTPCRGRSCSPNASPVSS